jgi:hypothetical protein
MTINLEILESAYLLGEKSLENLRTKELVPNMMVRRRLTRASKLVMELKDLVDFEEGRVICGSAYGEAGVSANILNAIKDNVPISPTDFQNSVYNTAVSYLSIVSKNHHEILTISSGDKTALNVLRAGAIKALDGDELLLVCFETIDIANIEQINHCIDFLECGVALRVRVSDQKATMSIEKSKTRGAPNSISELLHVAQNSKKIPHPILEVVL